MVIVLLLLLLVVFLVVPVEDVSVKVVVVFEMDVIFEEVVALVVVGLTNALIVAIVISFCGLLLGFT
jgi:hypothetical protein